MEEKNLRILKIDPQFKNLIRPLRKREYLQLEENLLADGCRDPLIVWNGFLVDGHNRYEICTRHQIPFTSIEMDFACREEAVAWICANQLGRRNISEETRRFLIGKQYEAEKLASKIKNPRGLNQYSEGKPDSEVAPVPREYSRHHTAARIAQENSISRGSVEKYAIYSRAIDVLAEKEPEIVPKILSGQYKIAHKNVVELSKLSPHEIRKVEQKIQKMQQPFVQYNKIQNVISSATEGANESVITPSVKDMPAFDPDADITVLTLTIPSWSSSINRVRTKTDLSIISPAARNGLVHELHSLIKHIKEMLAVIEED